MISTVKFCYGIIYTKTVGQQLNSQKNPKNLSLNIYNRIESVYANGASIPNVLENNHKLILKTSSLF